MLRIEHFSKTYPGGKKAVDDLTLQVRPGEICGFIGHNGAGKSTTLLAVAGILDFEQGEILVDGVSIKEDPLGCKRKIAFLPDNPDLYEHLTGVQYLNFIADVFGLDKQTREERMRRYADAFEITAALGDPIASYSHGMRQKLALVSAFLHQPRLLLLDEPFVGLDPKASHTLKGLFHELCQQGGAIFFSTHVLDVAERLCDRVAILRQGKLIAWGETEQVRGSESLEDVFLELTDDEA